MFIRAWTPQAQRAPTDDFWYQPLPYRSGAPITPTSALAVSAVYACVRVIAETVAQLPLHVYQREGRAKNRAPEHPLYALLHRRPNAWQTSFEFREMLTAHAALGGKAFAYILTGRGGRIEQLLPLNPERMKVEQLDSGALRFRYRDARNVEQTYTQDEVLYLRGMSLDGINGVSPLEIDREAVSMALTLQNFGARYFANDARSGMWVEYPTTFRNDDDRKKFAEAFHSARTGMNLGKAPVLEQGMKLHELKLSAADAQWIEARKYQNEDIARLYRMPPHKIGILDRATNNNIEHQSIEFVTDTVMPWVVRWEQALQRDIFDDDGERYFPEHDMKGLLRGDSKARSEFYFRGIQAGWLVRNEARDGENLNPLEGLDEPLAPLNMGPVGGDDEVGAEGGEPAQGAPAQGGSAPAESASAPTLVQFVSRVVPAEIERMVRAAASTQRSAASSRASHTAVVDRIVRAAAERVARKEAAAVAKLIERPDAAQAIEAFYASHEAFVAEVLGVDAERAAGWGRRSMEQWRNALDLGVASKWCDRWVQANTPSLMALALAE